MSKKGSVTTADYLPYADYQKLVQTLIDEKKYWWACYCILSFCTGLRFSDVCKLRWTDVLDQRKIIITAKKTNKTHVIPIGQNASDHFTSLYKKMGKPPKRDIILVGQKGEEGKAVSIQYINRTLKKWAVKYDLDIDNFSTHTFRKTFGRYVYDKGGQDEKTLMYLNRIFKHTSLDTTITYLGIRNDEISNIFDSIQI
ncbi:tyrosine-type recombinase/integrase [Lepagella muris]|uniref:Integrase n=1 Tax=Lepagella muris TaxID=3032870 RepID=A0AC61REJ3_9BACT|nr:tyrosine-type recombinase/integrase [Lepagella muris]TGY79033.1 integrase [Lepagella muris]THG52474.1 integrase [Bacteroidales bacterium]TKC54306.1 integrase [Bacteroidales bacterium]